jgi:hypothetical protein
MVRAGSANTLVAEWMGSFGGYLHALEDEIQLKDNEEEEGGSKSNDTMLDLTKIEIKVYL